MNSSNLLYGWAYCMGEKDEPTQSKEEDEGSDKKLDL